MSVAFYMDEHVPFAITAGLTLRGVDVLTVQEDNYQQAEDPVVLDRAMTLGRVVFTQYEDFLRESHRRTIQTETACLPAMSERRL